MNAERQIVPGVSIDAKGHANIAAALNDVLFDLALKLEDITNLPVDVQHVVAALVLASRRGEVQANNAISVDDGPLVTVLAAHVKSIFSNYGGELGSEE